MTGREDDYTWTKLYMANTQVFVVRNDSGIEGKDGLAGKVVGVPGRFFRRSIKEDLDLTSTLDSV